MGVTEYISRTHHRDQFGRIWTRTFAPLGRPRTSGVAVRRRLRIESVKAWSVHGPERDVVWRPQIGLKFRVWASSLESRVLTECRCVFPQTSRSLECVFIVGTRRCDRAGCRAIPDLVRCRSAATRADRLLSIDG